MPVLFDKISFGYLFGVMFFFLVVLAGLSSGIGYLEAVASTFADLWGWSRRTSTWFTLGLMFLMGIPSILAYGPWRDVLLYGRNCFEMADYLSGNILMPVGALLISPSTRPTSGSSTGSWTKPTSAQTAACGSRGAGNPSWSSSFRRPWAPSWSREYDLLAKRQGL